MRAVLFDLDDTLYPEREFVESGFRVVARFLGSRFDLNESVLVRRMWGLLETRGRGRIFDALLGELNLYTEERLNTLVHLYRSHRPAIRLDESVRKTLRTLRDRGMRLGIVTDGMASVQRKKIASLEVEGLFDALVCTDELGREHWKPSPLPFQVALELVQVRPAETAYVGDDPVKDFLAPNSLGMLTIHLTQHVRSTPLAGAGPNAAARVTVERFEEILSAVSEPEDVYKIGFH